VRALARSPEKLADVPWRHAVEVVQGDLAEPTSLTAAFAGVDVVYYLVHSMGTAPDFAAEERRAAIHVVGAARRAGVRRLIYLGGLHPSDAPLSPHLQSRTAVGEILLGSAIETLVLQAGVVVGSGSASFEMIRHLTDRWPVMTAPKWVHNKVQPIAIGDVLHYLVEAASAKVPSSRTWDIGGPDVLDYGEMMQIYAEEAGLRRRLIVALPFLTPWLASWWVGLVTPIPAGLARPLVESLHCDAVIVDDDVHSVMPPPHTGPVGYRESVRQALERVGFGHVETSCSTAGWPDEPPQALLPTDPPWAGETVHTITRSAQIPTTTDQVWQAIDVVTGADLHVVESREPGRPARQRHNTRAAGQEWLEMRVNPASGGGSQYEQRTIFHPRGLAGELYWYFGLPLHRRRSRTTFARVVAEAGGRRPATHET
jgi:uncharacterized protein YbjT (DUF2867 family)